MRRTTLFLLLVAGMNGQPAAVLRLAKALPLSGVKGHFDHFAFDPEQLRLFATLQQQGTVQVLDAETGTVTGTLTESASPMRCCIAAISIASM
jgi:hypothetical protein